MVVPRTAATTDKEEITISLNEKSVLIVGGSSGIGLGVAEALLQEGATVTIVGRTQEKLRAARESLGFGDRVKAIVADVTNEDQVRLILRGERHDRPPCRYAW
jgi:NAD(P)-dependent dehydrogenase (short-subunit alcohol dehydrogenase family)